MFDRELELGGYNIDDGSKYQSDNRIRTINYLKLKAGTYTLSFVNQGSVYVLKYDKNKTYLGYSQVMYRATEGSFTLENNVEYITFYYIPYNHEVTINEICQLEVGTTASEYIEHQEQNYPINLGDIELCKIGDYQDYIYKDNGKWYKHKEIGKVVLNGSENISSYAATSLSGSYQATFDILTKATSTDKVVLSNYFNSALLSDRTTKTNICYTYTDGLLRIANNLASTMEEFKSWLSTHNTTVYYVLATPIEEEITDTTLIAQLEAIYNNAKSYEGETHIFTITENESPYIEAEYSIDNIENTANKVTSIDENSTNKQYPSAKAVYDYGQDIYSTEEVKTNKVWIDGKPLYRKVVNFGELPNATAKQVSHNVNNIDIVVNIGGYLNDSRIQGFYPLPLQYMGSDSTYNAELLVDRTNIIIKTNTNRSMCSAYVVIEYTKTTD